MFRILQYLRGYFGVTRIMTVDFLFSLILALFLGWFVSFIYQKVHTTFNYEESFLISLSILPAIVTLIMFFIQGDLVLSLGLVGSLSIVRFRTPIKDTKDMVFLFLSIAIGLGCGTYNAFFTIIGVFVFGLAFILLNFLQYGKKLHSDYLLIIQGTKDNLKQINKIINDSGLEVNLRSHDIEENFWEVVFEFRLEEENKMDLDSLLSSIRKKAGITKVSLLAPQLPLPM